MMNFVSNNLFICLLWKPSDVVAGIILVRIEQRARKTSTADSALQPVSFDAILLEWFLKKIVISERILSKYF